MESNRILLSLLLIGLISAATSTAALVGGYQPIKDLSDPYLVEIAKFAVSEHNKQASKQLVFVKIVSGEQQVVAGTNYKLIISAKTVAHRRNGVAAVYQAVVYDKPWTKYRSLTSFEKVAHTN